MERAREIQANLPSRFPSFVKYMLRSHVTGGFWLGLPKNFTCNHLPEKNDIVVLVDETGVEHETNYLWEKNGLSGGWRKFSLDHQLREGDVLIFHLIDECKFKVYIVRVKSEALIETDIDLSLVNLGARATEMVGDYQERDPKITVLAREEHLEQYPEKDMVALLNDEDAAENYFEMDVDDYDSGIRFSQPVIDFKDVKTFSHFNIIVYGFSIDHRISQHLRVKYYELCCSQKSYLHDQLKDGLNLQLVVGVISETISIADAIRSSMPTSSENLISWDKILEGFEILGMKVGFLRARINKLVTISSDAKDALERKILEKVNAEEELRALILEKVKAEKEVKALQIKLIDVKKVIANSDHKIEYMKKRAERLEAVFLQESKAPW
nr:PREDICTED: B3 domain-containing protein Os01g0234100-like [Daucus carota subsp. sativus]